MTLTHLTHGKKHQLTLTSSGTQLFSHQQEWRGDAGCIHQRDRAVRVSHHRPIDASVQVRRRHQHLIARLHGDGAIAQVCHQRNPRQLVH